MLTRPAALLFALCLATPAMAELPARIDTASGPVRVETVARGLEHPWGLAFLPDGRMLVTERPGRLRVVTREGRISAPVGGVPAVYAVNQGGLLDIALDRDFARSATLYICYAEPAGGGSRTALASARFVDGEAPRLDDVRVIFRQEPATSRGLHYGCRIAQTADGNLFLGVGDHYGPRDEAQNLANHLGKVIRIRPDGSVPPDNPFVGRANARPEIWSYGHRNVQGMALHPRTGEVWLHEHGPRGGDEINIPRAGRNYGWPVIGYGVDYSGARIHAGTARPGMEQPLHHWTPSIAPAGMAFYTADLIPAWKGSLFVGALARASLVRLEMDGERLEREERLLDASRERVRDVRQGPDGALWLLTDANDGRLVRLAPARSQ